MASLAKSPSSFLLFSKSGAALIESMTSRAAICERDFRAWRASQEFRVTPDWAVAHWVTVYFGQLFENYRIARILGLHMYFFYR
jgi:hypothetical protein